MPPRDSLPDQSTTGDLSAEGIASGSGLVPKSHLFGPAAPSADKCPREVDDREKTCPDCGGNGCEHCGYSGAVALDQTHSKTEEP